MNDLLNNINNVLTVQWNILMEIITKWPHVMFLHIDIDPTPVQLIVQFLEQASKPSVNEQNQVQPPVDNRRNRTLKLLALEVAAYMKWDLDVLEKG